MDEIRIGDAVVPIHETDHDVMTVYDVPRPFTHAHCNWLVGTKMFKSVHPVDALMKLRRRQRKQQN